MVYPFNQLNNTTTILLTLSVILLAGFLLTRITKKAKLPNVTGYIIAGIVIGPYVLKLIPSEMVGKMGFVSDIALSFIAFGVGRFFVKESFKETGIGIIAITLLESLIPGFLITLCLRLLFHMDWSFSLLLGAIATATAPASTMVTISQYHARGPFVNILLQVTAFDDAVCLIAFSIATAVVSAKAGADLSTWDIVLPILYNISALVVGFLCGLVLSKLMTPDRSEDNRLILTISLLLGIAGLCAIVDVSPLLACMVFGTTYINTTKDKQLYDQVEKFTPPIMSLFFVISGMNLDITSFQTLGVIGVAYFIIRIIGKYSGAYLGCLVAKSPKPVRNYLGMALTPQAGVAIGLAFLGQRILPGAEGNMLLTIILSSSVLYELIGPACAKFALIRSGSIPKQNLEGSKGKAVSVRESNPDETEETQDGKETDQSQKAVINS